MKKESSFINLGSITYAQKAQLLLENMSVEATVGKMPSATSGCTFGVFIKDVSRDEVISLLRSSGIKIL